jgi:signal peptidase I
MNMIKPIVGVVAVAAVLCAALGMWWLLTLSRESPCTRTFSIPSAAMRPTLEIGDVICADTTRFANHDPADGDIVVFSPPEALGKFPFIKRIIGSPGETIEILDGLVYRNGKRVVEPYVSARATYTLEVKDFDVYVDGAPISNHTLAVIPSKKTWDRPNRIPKAYYLVLGDNRDDSDDSHLWGFVRRDQLWGRATTIYWPLSHARSLLR